VSGYSGIGKSSVVNELHKRWSRRVAFRLRQVRHTKRDIPYSTLGQAFQMPVRSLLAKQDDLGRWRDPSARLWARMDSSSSISFSQLEFVIGKTPPVAELCRPRMRRTLSHWCSGPLPRRFASRSTRCGSLTIVHGWTQQRSNLLEHLVTHLEVAHLRRLAYRTTRSIPSHPASLLCARCTRSAKPERGSGYRLAPFFFFSSTMSADSSPILFHCEPEPARPLGAIQEKDRRHIRSSRSSFLRPWRRRSCSQSTQSHHVAMGTAIASAPKNYNPDNVVDSWPGS